VAGLFVGFIIMAVLIAVLSGVGNPASAYDALLRNGTPARGILLRVASTPSGRGGSMQRRFQLRSVVIDVEIPGREPFVVSVTPWIPMNLVRDVLPGATVELRVDPSRPDRIAIVGPGVGFTGLAQLLPPPPPPPGAA